MATSARLDELKKKFDENPRRYFAPLANEYRKLGDLSQAIALCRTHLPNQPGHVSGHIVLAQTLYEARELGESRQIFEASLDLDPENLIALRFLGDIAREQGETEAARSWYERVLDADPRNDEIATLLRDLPVESAEPEPIREELHLSAPLAIDDSDVGALDVQGVDAEAEDPGFESAETPAFVEVAIFEPVNFDHADAVSPRVVEAESERAEPAAPALEPSPAPARVSVGVESMDDPFFGARESAPTPAGVHTTSGAVESIDDWFHPATTAGAVVEFTTEETEDEPPTFDESLLPDLRRLTPSSAATTTSDLAMAFESPITPDEAALAFTLPSVDARSSAPTPAFLNAVPEPDTAIVADQMPFDGAFDLIEVGSPAEHSTPQLSSRGPGVAPDGLLPVAALEHESSRSVDSDEVLGVAPEHWSTPTSVPVSALNDVRLEVDTVDAASLESAPIDGLVMEDGAFEDVLATVPEVIPFMGTTMSVPVADLGDGDSESPNAEDDDSPAAVVGAADAWVSEGDVASPIASETETTTNAARLSHETDFFSSAEVELIVAPDLSDFETRVESVELEAEEQVGDQPEEQLDVVAADAVAPSSAGLDLATAAADDLAPADDALVVNHSAADQPGDAPVYRSPAFVTETMAELYVQQGFRDEALAIYRQLMAARPDDTGVRSRLAALEASVVAADSVEAAVSSGESGGRSVRDFFALFARRVPGRRPQAMGEPASVAADAPQSDDSDPAIAALAADATPGAARSGPTLNELFGAAGVAAADASAAVNLSAAFAPGDPPAASRTVGKELSLEHLFRDVPARSSGAVTLDEYYNGSSARESERSTPAAQHTEEGDERGADIEQFTAWLEGLKKK